MAKTWSKTIFVLTVVILYNNPAIISNRASDVCKAKQFEPLSSFTEFPL